MSSINSNPEPAPNRLAYIVGLTLVAMVLAAFIGTMAIDAFLSERKVSVRQLGEFKEEILGGPQFQDKLAAVLLANPQIIVDALNKYQEDQAAAAELASPELVARAQVTESAFVAGASEPAVTIVEFYDHNCPYCRDSVPIVKAALEKHPDVRVIVRDYPIFPDSKPTAAIALALRAQALYEPFITATATDAGRVDETRAMAIASELGADMNRLDADRKSPEIEKIIADNMALGQDLKVSGTPTLLFEDRIIRGLISAEAFDTLITEAREKAAAAK